MRRSSFAFLSLLPFALAGACATGDSSSPGPTDTGAPNVGDTSMVVDDTGHEDASGGETAADTSANEAADEASTDSTAGDAADDEGADASVDSTIDSAPIDTGTPDTGATSGDTGVPFTDAGRPPGCGTTVPSGQVFASTMVGCAGKVSWDQRSGLCIGGWVPCSAAEWTSLKGSTAPAFDYWVDDNLKYSGSSTACFASNTAGNTCSSSTAPFHVCASTSADPQGNVCNWAHCGLEKTAPDEDFGGGCTNTTAGALCCLPPCASGVTTMETFGNGVFGCVGSVTYANRASLCGNGYKPCTAAQWVAGFGGVAPKYNYWTDDDLKYNGTGPNACFVSLTTGNDCGSTPMRVCGASPDPQGNVCNWTGCGIDTTSPNDYFGGCAGNTNAGTLCCPD